MRKWNDLFTNSSFYYLKKNEILSTELLVLKKSIILSNEIEKFHPQRKDEFLLGRICASMAHNNYFKRPLLDLPAAEDRSPMWPIGVVGSITHNRHYVGAVVGSSGSCKGVGIDLEEMGRTKIELHSHITNAIDLKTHPNFTSEELLTLIFSIKESLFKALFPQVQMFFGFQDAAVLEIDSSKGEFVIKLLKELNHEFKPGSTSEFHGKYSIQEGHCLTVIEI